MGTGKLVGSKLWGGDGEGILTWQSFDELLVVGGGGVAAKAEEE